jgi:hypothetical protein
LCSGGLFWHRPHGVLSFVAEVRWCGFFIHKNICFIYA